MGIYEEVHGKDELKESGQDSAPYMRHLKGESLHVWAFMRRCTDKMKTSWAGSVVVIEGKVIEIRLEVTFAGCKGYRKQE